VAIRVVSTGDSLLGVTYGMGAGGKGAASSAKGAAATAASSAAASASGPRSTLPAAGSGPLVLAEPSHLAPGGSFGKWVPTAADVQPVTASTPPPALRDLGKRARTFFRDTAETTARFAMDGRRLLRDFDLIDVLPLPQRHRRRKGDTTKGVGALVEAMRRAYGPTLGHVGPEPLRDGPLPSRLLPPPPRPRPDGGVADGADAGSADADSGTSSELPWRGRFGFGQSTWYMGRVRIHGASGGPAGADGAGAAGADAVAGAASGSGKDASSSAADNKAYVYYFEAAVGGDLTVVPVLRVVPLSDVLLVAPAGTYTCPLVPGQRVDSRRMGGRWAPAEVVRASRHAVVLRAARPSRESDLSATAPRAFALFSKTASPMRMAASGGSVAASASAAATEAAKKGAANSTPAVAAATAALTAESAAAPEADAAVASAAAAAASTTPVGEPDTAAAAAATATAAAPSPAPVPPPSPAGPASRKDRIAALRGQAAAPLPAPPTQLPSPTTADAGFPLSVGIGEGEEEVPQHMWLFQIARAGFYCPLETSALLSVPEFGATKAHPAGAGQAFGRGRGLSIADRIAGRTDGGDVGGVQPSAVLVGGKALGPGKAGAAGVSGTVAQAAAYVAEAEKTRKR
jgi:hypothetical protein